ncbi:MAG TPA: hypothetical protein IAA53_08040 [Candidatus Avoscillospira avicola]|uniref:Uncharacterized protein n=1 Tax=Candidatus Avoscillospira avicola TaxID=2840706 RepID=A0A9D1DIF8_9FIRM|nr:hypothetical protein [Candidatus Avoscillospira avicola]
MAGEKRFLYRCPVCFGRENDVVLRRQGDRWYCIKCSFTGSSEEIEGMYRDLKKKFRLMTTRITLEDLEADRIGPAGSFEEGTA